MNLSRVSERAIQQMYQEVKELELAYLSIMTGEISSGFALLRELT